MFFPAYIHKDPDCAYSVTFPDFPGCFTAVDELADLPRLAQEAVEVYFEGEDAGIAPPSTFEDWCNDERFQGGCWVRVDIDLSGIRPASVIPQ